MKNTKKSIAVVLLMSCTMLFCAPNVIAQNYNTNGSYTTAQYTPNGYYNPYQTSGGGYQQNTTNPYNNPYQNPNTSYPNSYPTYGNSNNYNQYSPSQTYNNGQSYNNYNQTYNGYAQYNAGKVPLYRNQSTLELTNMINQIGDRLRQKNNIATKVTFKLNNDSVKNAYTNFNNTITIYRGLIEYCEDGDELAYVIGHEMGHATGLHIVKGAAVSTGTKVAKEVLWQTAISKIDNYWGRVAVDTATDVAADAIDNKYSRHLETDADLRAIDYVVAAGYNPLAAISIMNKIGENYADFWADHPSTDKRVVTMYNYIKQKYPAFLDSGYNTYSYKQAIANYIK